MRFEKRFTIYFISLPSVRTLYSSTHLLASPTLSSNNITLPFLTGMCFHVPPSAVPNGGFCAYVLGFCICVYTLDALYVQFYMTELIETTRFNVLPSGVQMTMDVSDRFQRYGARNGGFVYVCLPWVDRNQWHAFSLFEHPTEPQRRQVFMLNTGDWTKRVHNALQRNTVRPVWVCGPFSSPYNTSIHFDNQILVASGIGITPALSVIRAHKDSRRINLIWACSDPAMLEFFLEHLYLDHEGWNLIFYTGDSPLNPAIEELNTNVKVMKCRPSLPHVIANIIHGIESETVLPEDSIPCDKCQVIRVLLGKLAELDESDKTEDEKVKDLTRFAHNLGYQFGDLFNHLEGNDGVAEPETRDAFESLLTSKSGQRSATSSEIEDDTNHLHALLTTIRRFGIRHSSMSIKNFLMDKDEVLNTSRRRSSILVTACRPWEKNDMAAKYVKGLSKRRVLSTWGILYCGGSPAVEKELKEISKEYQIKLNSESFAW